MFVGIDVAKEELVVAVRPGGASWASANDEGPDVLSAVDVDEMELIEVYRSVSERPNWAAGNSCGAIAIYTR